MLFTNDLFFKVVDRCLAHLVTAVFHRKLSSITWIPWLKVLTCYPLACPLKDGCSLGCLVQGGWKRKVRGWEEQSRRSTEERSTLA